MSTVTFLVNYLAQAYGQGDYGEAAYQTGSSSSQAAGGALANTGVSILLVVSIACAIICAALLVRFWRRPAQNKEQ